MSDTFASILRRSRRKFIQVEALSPQDRERMRVATERARQRLQAAGLLDVEQDAQREIRARVEAA